MAISNCLPACRQAGSRLLLKIADASSLRSCLAEFPTWCVLAKLSAKPPACGRQAQLLITNTLGNIKQILSFKLKHLPLTLVT